MLGCDKATGNVVVLDPTGAAEPHVAFPAVPQFPLGIGCGLGWTDFGLLSLDAHDEESGALMLHRFPADPRAGVSSPEESGGNIVGGVLLTMGIIGLAVGAPLLGVGAARFSKHQKWKKGQQAKFRPAAGRTPFGTITPGVEIRF